MPPLINPLQHEQNSRFQELDALRGLAAILVLLFHYSATQGNSLDYTLFKYGVTGVDLFFIISGFVIFRSVTNAKNGWEFLINRFTRLFPTYWTAVSFTFIIILINERFFLKTSTPDLWDVYLHNLTMFQFYFDVRDLDGPYWTMIIEMLFYLLMFVLIISKSLKSTIPLLVIFVLFGTLLGEFYKGHGGEFYTDYFTNFPFSQFAPLFLSGILFYRIKQKTGNLMVNVLLIIGCYLLQVLLFDDGLRAANYISHPEYKATIGIYFMFMFLFSFNKLRWIVNPITLYLGKISFALYLIHQYISIELIIPHLKDAGFDFRVAAYLIALPVCIIVASLITFYIEKPISPWLRKKLNLWLLVQLPTKVRKNKFYQRVFLTDSK